LLLDLLHHAQSCALYTFDGREAGIGVVHVNCIELYTEYTVCVSMFRIPAEIICNTPGIGRPKPPRAIVEVYEVGCLRGKASFGQLQTSCGADPFCSNISYKLSLSNSFFSLKMDDSGGVTACQLSSSILNFLLESTPSVAKGC